MSDDQTDSSPRSPRAGEAAGHRRPRISVAIITRNEQANIADCLDSVAWADEIVVVDQGSTDGTGELARDRGARVIVAPEWHGFGHQKNLAVDACSGDWILALDADERVPAALAAEIAATVLVADRVAYEIPRQSSYCGRFLRHGGWADDRVLRLFRRGSGRFSPDRVHERLLVQGPIGRLRNHLLHYSIRTLEDALQKVNRYSTESALMLVREGARPTIFTALLHGGASFLRTYVLKLGFLDGSHGLMLAISNAEGSYYRYVKAMLAAREAQGGK